MVKRFCGILCIVVLCVPSVVLYAQDETSPENRPEEPKLKDTAPAQQVVIEGGAPDSVGSVEVIPESLAVVPAVIPIILAPQPAEELREYEFKGTSRDIVIGAAVLAGWIFVAFLAANQRSE